MPERPPAAKVALLGGPSGGKSTLFAALTGLDYARAAVQSAAGPNLARVPILDPRLAELRAAEGSDVPIVPPAIELTDTPPLLPDDDKNAAKLGALREADAFVAVLGVFAAADPAAECARQRAWLTSLLFWADLQVLESRTGTLRKRLTRSIPAKEKEEDVRELEVLERMVDPITAGDAGPVLALKPEESKRLRGFRFFSAKPTLWVPNVAEAALPSKLENGLAAKFELEIAALADADRREFLDAYGMAQPAAPALLPRIYQLLGIVTFFTTGQDEVAGWPILSGTRAVDAAAKIHTDLSKGFVAAEVTSWADWKAGRRRPRLEGRDYVVADGDIVVVRSSR